MLPGDQPRIPFFSRMSPVCAMYFFLGLVSTFPESYMTMLFIRFLGPAEVQVMYAVMYTPWILKFFVAVVIDRWRFKPVTYIFTMLPITAFLWFVTLMASNPYYEFVNLVMVSMVLCIADVALDGIMVRRVQMLFYQESPEGSIKTEYQLQAKVSRWASIGMALGSLIGGFVMDAYGSKGIFVVMSGISIAFFGTSCLLMERSYHPIADTHRRISLPPPDPPHPLNVSISRDPMTAVPKRASMMSALQDPVTRGVLLFNFFVHLVPEFGGLYDTFMVADLGFTAKMIGILDMFGYIGIIIGASLYERFLPDSDKNASAHTTRRGVSPRRIVQWMLVLIVIESCTIPVGLVKGWYVSVGITAATWAAFSGVMRSATDKMLLNPIRGSILQFCEDGNATTMYATFTAVANAASIAAMCLGSVMSEAAGLRKGNMGNLWILSVCKSVIFATLIPFTTAIPMPKDNRTVSQRQTDDSLEDIQIVFDEDVDADL